MTELIDKLNEFIYDASIERQIYLLRNRAGLVRKIKKALKEHDLEFTDNLVSRLYRLSGIDLERLSTAAGFETQELKRLENLLDKFEKTSAETFSRVINEELDNLVEDEYLFQRRTYLNGIEQAGLISGFVFAPTLVKSKQVRKSELSVGKTQDEIIYEWAARRKQKVLSTIRISALSQDKISIEEIVKEVSGTNSRFGGILRATHYGAIVFGETLHQSAVTSVAVAISQMPLKQGDGGDVSQVDLLWSSMLDSKTSSKCFVYNNKLVFEQLNGFRPPAHPRCRSTTILWFGGKKPPKSETSTKWFRRQSEDVKKRILGKTRYEAYQEDSSSLSFPKDFISNSGDKYTLEQLKQKNKI